MTVEEKITISKSLIGDEDVSDSIITAYLDLAKNAMLKRLYPFGTTDEILPPQYDMDQCELAVRMFGRRGAEGETSHSENSISRTYGSVNDEDILSRLVPFAKVM